MIIKFKYFVVMYVILISCSFSYAEYNRRDFNYWIDVDKDGQNTREEILVRDGKDIVLFNNKPIYGYWVCVYTGKIFTDPKKMDVDHIVPLYNAYLSGADSWSKEQKKMFANDMENLLAVSLSSNRSKGSDSPDKWLPRKEYCLDYVLKWVYIKQKYRLKYTKEELKAIGDILINYGN